jgi:tRNA(fMet)-specific endonuclease VapC
VELIDKLRFEVLDFDREDARQAGEVRAQLALQGQPIGPYDILIAGQALARGLTLVTHNVGEFGRVGGLKIEDWLTSSA